MFDLYSIYEQPGWSLLALILIGIWSLIWEGLALWHAAQRKQKGWFVAILILNTLGLLPIIYLIWFKDAKVKNGKKSKRGKR
ncbi:MAG TPA: DUF5652 family protein [Candidatus Nanoarchaeia archaeon]|nr:DUF5652 family protein [Candidatus Nanoarchaeia archaeon]